MLSGEDFLFRPVLAGLIRYESLHETSLTLYDIALLNDAIDVKEENQKRLYDATQRQKEGK